MLAVSVAAGGPEDADVAADAPAAHGQGGLTLGGHAVVGQEVAADVSAHRRDVQVESGARRHRDGDVTRHGAGVGQAAGDVFDVHVAAGGLGRHRLPGPADPDVPTGRLRDDVAV